ncbi:hypothetical protein [Herpetosiphon giganteus]|uniref:hypothetical protein n=1 Tax=Herpetosiphon giganteus TaxID=2029754 RepID=UPI001958160F|nr:hypothetical protein [Herpetosiphon giganteus]MBM7842547.1 xanthosine utilization system XapX-like protein [Herpetosiphon giganteus]
MLFYLWLLGTILIAWISLCYGYAFFKTKIRWFLLHSLRWLSIGQYFALFCYLIQRGALPLPYAELIIVGIIGLIIGRKYVPMLRNAYTEGPYRSSDLLLLRVQAPAQAAAQGVFVPFNGAVDVGSQRTLRNGLIVHSAIVMINFLILYGAFVMAQ